MTCSELSLGSDSGTRCAQPLYRLPPPNSGIATGTSKEEGIKLQTPERADIVVCQLVLGRAYALVSLRRCVLFLSTLLNLTDSQATSRDRPSHRLQLQGSSPPRVQVPHSLRKTRYVLSVYTCHSLRGIPLTLCTLSIDVPPVFLSRLTLPRTLVRHSEALSDDDPGIKRRHQTTNKTRRRPRQCESRPADTSM